MREPLLESLQKEESSFSSTPGDNKLDALKEKKARLESICSYLKDQRAHFREELFQAREWMSRLALFVNKKEALKEMGESLILTGTFIQYCSPAQETG